MERASTLRMRTKEKVISDDMETYIVNIEMFEIDRNAEENISKNKLNLPTCTKLCSGQQTQY